MQVRSNIARQTICSCLLVITTAFVSSNMQPVSGNSSSGSSSVTAASSAKKTAASTEAAQNAERAKYSLPDLASPSEYELQFEPDLSSFTFKGTESIKLNILKPCNEIILNSKTLRIQDAFISAENSSKKVPLQVKLDEQTEKASFISPEELKPGSYELHCSFDGKLTEELRGFFRVSHEDAQHNKHWIAATQMEPTDARRMFPCFDEPAYKAIFKISVLINKDHVAISNAPILKEEASGSEKKLVRFEPTPKMSSYLLCLVTGEFKCSGEVMSGSVPIRVWAPAGKEQLGKYALSEAAKILDCEAKYFGIPYLGKKLDMIALPDFSAGAMENIGAITYMDTALLIDEKTGSSFQRQSIFGTMAHEMAHQWFGDLVTMAWWDDLWLNESFATWMTSKVEETLHPEWRSMTEGIYHKYGAMSTDSLKTTRPIHAVINSPAQAIEMFDGITYQKGCAVLQMIESFVGAENFQKGINNYLKEHSFGNATAENFWNAIAAQAPGVPVAAIMRDFVYQPGFPQINIVFSKDGTQLSLTQYRQFKLGQDKKDPTIWKTPIVYRHLSDEKGKSDSATFTNVLLTQRQQSFPTKVAGSGDIFVNAGGKGYYKCAYPPAYFNKLLNDYKRLSTEEKIVFIADCSSLVPPGEVPVESMMELTKKIKDETDPMILSDLVAFVRTPYPYMQDASKPLYQKWIRHILKPLKAKYNGWNQKQGDSQHVKSLRSEILLNLGTIGQDKQTIDESFFMFNRYLNDRTAINPDLVSTVFNIICYNGGSKEYDQILQLYKHSTIPADKRRALHSLDTFHQLDLAKRTLAMAMSGEVQLQQGLSMITGISSNRYTRDYGWDWVKKHWAEMFKHFPENHLSSLVWATSFDTPEREKEVVAWYNTHPIPFSRSDTARMLESLHNRVIYKQRYGTRIKNWVISQSKT